jgi:hypothetical protein
MKTRAAVPLGLAKGPRQMLARRQTRTPEQARVQAQTRAQTRVTQTAQGHRS